MEVTYISNREDNIITRSCVIQCCCVGHCSYLELIQLSNYFYFNIIASNKKYNKYFSKNQLCFTKETITKLINELDAVLNRDSIGIVTIPEHEYFIVIHNIENTIYQLCFYDIKRNGKHKLIFDITITKEMLQQLINTLNTWI